MRNLIGGNAKILASLILLLFPLFFLATVYNIALPLLLSLCVLPMLLGKGFAQGTAGSLFKGASLPAQKHWNRPSFARNAHVSMAALRYPAPIKLEPKGTPGGCVIFLHGLGGKLVSNCKTFVAYPIALRITYLDTCMRTLIHLR